MREHWSKNQWTKNHWSKNHPGRYMYCLYVLLAAVLTIGWYPEGQAGSLNTIMGSTLQKMETICLLSENNRLFLQGVAETGVTERRQNEQMDEHQRRVVETIQKKEEAAEKKKSSRKKEGIRKKAKSKVKAASGISSGSRQILERIVEAEAGDQDLRGRRLVANVVLNRVKSKKFPNTVKGVVFAPRQFSPISNGMYYRVHVSNKTKKAVRRALQGEDDSRGALYFMCRSASSARNVAWFDRDLKRLFKYGCHEFFR